MSVEEPPGPPEGFPADGPATATAASGHGDDDDAADADGNGDDGDTDGDGVVAEGIGAGDTETGSDDEAGRALPPVSDALLGPLFDSAGEALRRLRPVDLQPAARRLRDFDRRGLATPTARLQLRRLLDGDEALLAAAAALLLARPEAARLASAWEEAIAAGGDAPLALVRGAAGEGRLPLMASVLTAGVPDGVEFGLGLIVAMAAAGGRENDAAEAVRAAAAGQGAAEEAQRRAEAARSAAEAEVARLDAALREERRARRERDRQAAETTTGFEARRAELEAAVAEAEDRSAAAGRRAVAAERGAAEAERRATEADRRATEADRRATEALSRAVSTDERAVAAERRAISAEQRAAGAGAPFPRGGSGALAEASRAGGSRPAPVHPDALVAAGEEERIALGQVARAAEELAAWLHRLADGPSAPPAAAGVHGPGPAREPPPRPPPPPPAQRAAAGRVPGPAAGTRNAGAAGAPVGGAPRPPPGSPGGTSVAETARPATPGAGARAGPSGRRTPVRVPPGMLGDDPAAVAAMVRTPGVAVIVDGYNVSMSAWPDASAADQRERLCDALAEFQLRVRREVTVVFDGAEVAGVRPLRRRGLRVVFSAAGQEADEVVVDEVMFRPADVPVIVVSSDREVRERAESEGATVLGSDAFLQLMGR